MTRWLVDLYDGLCGLLTLPAAFLSRHPDPFDMRGDDG